MTVLPERAREGMDRLVAAEHEIHTAMADLHGSGALAPDELGPLWSAVKGLHAIHHRLGLDPVEESNAYLKAKSPEAFEWLQSIQGATVEETSDNARRYFSAGLD